MRLPVIACPHRVLRGRGIFASPEVRDVAALLGFLTDPRNPLHLAACLRGPAVGLSDATLVRLALGRGRLDARVLAGALPSEALPDEGERWSRFVAVARRLRAGLDRRSLVDLLEDAWAALGTRAVLAASPHGEEQLGNLEVVRQLASRWDARGRPDPAAFARRLVELAERDPRIDVGGGGGRPGWTGGPAADRSRREGPRVAGGVHCRPRREPSADHRPAPGRSSHRARLPTGRAVERRSASHTALGLPGGVARQPRARREPAGPLRRDDPGPRSPGALGHPGAWRPAHLGELDRSVLDSPEVRPRVRRLDDGACPALAPQAPTAPLAVDPEQVRLALRRLEPVIASPDASLPLEALDAVEGCRRRFQLRFLEGHREPGLGAAPAPESPRHRDRRLEVLRQLLGALALEAWRDGVPDGALAAAAVGSGSPSPRPRRSGSCGRYAGSRGCSVASPRGSRGRREFPFDTGLAA